MLGELVAWLLGGRGAAIRHFWGRRYNETSRTFTTLTPPKLSCTHLKEDNVGTSLLRIKSPYTPLILQRFHCTDISNKGTQRRTDPPLRKGQPFFRAMFLMPLLCWSLAVAMFVTVQYHSKAYRNSFSSFLSFLAVSLLLTSSHPLLPVPSWPLGPPSSPQGTAEMGGVTTPTTIRKGQWGHNLTFMVRPSLSISSSPSGVQGAGD